MSYAYGGSPAGLEPFFLYGGDFDGALDTGGGPPVVETPVGPFYRGISTGKGQRVPISAGPLIMPPFEGIATPTTAEGTASFFALLKSLPIRDSDAVV